MHMHVKVALFSPSSTLVLGVHERFVHRHCQGSNFGNSTDHQRRLSSALCPKNRCQKVGVNLVNLSVFLFLPVNTPEIPSELQRCLVCIVDTEHAKLHQTTRAPCRNPCHAYLCNAIRLSLLIWNRLSIDYHQPISLWSSSNVKLVHLGSAVLVALVAVLVWCALLVRNGPNFLSSLLVLCRAISIVDDS